MKMLLIFNYVTVFALSSNICDREIFIAPNECFKFTIDTGKGLRRTLMLSFNKSPFNRDEINSGKFIRQHLFMLPEFNWNYIAKLSDLICSKNSLTKFIWPELHQNFAELFNYINYYYIKFCHMFATCLS